MLGSIIKLLNERGSLSVHELALALGIESTALRPMLEMLAHKGKVEKIELPCKGGCAGCASSCFGVDAITYYKSAKN